MSHIYLKLAFLMLILLSAYKSGAQVLTTEDSLAAGLISRNQVTVLSGYGEARYSIDTRRQTAEASLKRIVLFVGHKFNKNISLFTELEIEDAVAIGEVGDEGEIGKGGISMEQAFLKFNLNPATYIVAGLFIPRFGFINENHLPTTFNGVDRPILEELVIPSTWREVGVGIYGQVNGVPGLNYTVSLVNGLNSGGFKNGSGIRNGRQLGSKAQGLNLAIVGSLLQYTGNFRIQASGYFGGSTALEKRVADSLQLNSGTFGNAVAMGEMNVQYTNQGLNIRAIGSIVNIGNANQINRAFANNTPTSIYGGYGEVGYNILYSKYKNEKAFVVFSRYEYMNLSAKLPSNGVQNNANNQHYMLGGFTFKPIRGVAIKADYTQRITGKPNTALIVTPFPQLIPYYTSNGFFDLGLAYNF